MLWKPSSPSGDHNDRRAGQSTGPSAPHAGHVVFATLFAVGLIGAYLVINTPSASTKDARTLARDRSVFPEDEAIFKPVSNNVYMVFQGEPDNPELKEVTKSQTRELFKVLPWETEKVKKGDTLSRIFDRGGIDAGHAYAVAKLPEASMLLKIRPGQEIKVAKSDENDFKALQYGINKFETLNILLDDGEYIVEIEKKEPEIRINNASGRIKHSLLGATKDSGISLNTMYEFVALFGWQVDFANDIHVGDQFSIIYEELFLDDTKIGTGEIIAAELIVSGRKLQAIRHQDENGFTDYYAPDGDGIKGTFLRTPMKFGNITSSFSKSRLHPIKKVWTAHKGVDYGAPRGTPVLSTGDGVVRKVGRNGGYGKTIIIRHGGKYETVYAHLNGYAKGLKSGSRVKQGDVIGYVGSTGLATGPHLHYEFRVNGIHKNPVTVELPKSEPIDGKYRDTFALSAGIWVSELENLRQISLAQNNAVQ